jgi:hypothetical protein
MAKSVVCASHNRLIFGWAGRLITMDTIYFLLAVGVVSTIIFVLTTRADRARGSSDGGSYDGGTSSANDGWVASWFGPTHSTDISGSWDSGGGWSGGDSGGADAGGGGGSSD